jgi:single-strand DNA-binding protein
MNSLHIIGRLTADPELRTTTNGNEVCSFDVAVNRRKTPNNQNPGTDYFRVSAWNEKGKVCNQYLSKGKLVSVTGPVSVRSYTNSKGEARASLEVKADDVEFLSPKGESQPHIDEQSGYVQVSPDDLPYC